MTPLVHGYMFQPSVAQSRSVDSPKQGVVYCSPAERDKTDPVHV